MQLGPIQEKWVKALEDNPEEQGFNKLGNITDNKYCCLGKLCMILHEIKGTTPTVTDISSLIDNDSLFYLKSYKKAGLLDEAGELKEYAKIDNKSYASLADMNDNGCTWTEIAAYIRANPDNVFNKSV